MKLWANEIIYWSIKEIESTAFPYPTNLFVLLLLCLIVGLSRDMSLLSSKGKIVYEWLTFNSGARLIGVGGTDSTAKDLKCEGN